MRDLIVAFETKNGQFPPEYIEMKYRERFHLSHRQFNKEPESKIDRDLVMIGVENNFKN